MSVGCQVLIGTTCSKEGVFVIHSYLVLGHRGHTTGNVEIKYHTSCKERKGEGGGEGREESKGKSKEAAKGKAGKENKVQVKQFI